TGVCLSSDLLVFPIRPHRLQDRLRLPLFQTLRFHPCPPGRFPGRGNGLGGGVEICADVEEIQQIASVPAKAFFHLIGNPVGLSVGFGIPEN
ncbi:MAG: hypothetical protein LBF93_02780, partial [Zoogloeaceae bacterium]|nr:hypothetical protein [Zoogloeaceae bacterium]